MKYVLRIVAILMGFFLIVSLTSCTSTRNIDGSMSATATATTISVTATVSDPDGAINEYGVHVVVYQIDDDETVDDYDLDDCTTVSTLTFDDLPTTDDESETETADDLDMDTAFVLKLYCTVGSSKTHTIEIITCSTNSEGTTEDNPIEITTEDQLYDMESDPDAYYVLDNDIDLSNEDELDPIFDSGTPFDGNFDCQGYTISGFTETESASYMGLFGYVGEDATISNLTIDSPTITISRSSSTYYGSVCGYNSGTLSNITVTDANLTYNGESTSTSLISYAGGFVGVNLGTISDCSITGSFTNTYASRVTLGGFVGWDKGTTTECTANMDIESSTDSDSSSTEVLAFDIGGFVGKSDAHITNCISTGTLDITFSYSTDDDEIDTELANDLGGFAGLINSGYINRSVSNESITYTSSLAYIMNIGMFAGLVSTNMSATNIADDVVVGTNNSITLSLLDDDDVYNFTATLVDSDDSDGDGDTDDDVTVVADRVFRFGFINSIDDDVVDAFESNNDYSVIGDPTITLDATDYVSCDYSSGVDYTSLTNLNSYVLEYIESLSL